MKKLVISISKVLVLSVILAIAIILPTIFIPVSPEITERVTEDIQKSILPLMLMVSLLGATSVSFIIKFSKRRGLKLIVGLVFAFWGIEYFMAQIETFYFRESFPFMSLTEMFNILLRGLITTAIIIPIATSLFGKTKILQNNENKEDIKKIIFNTEWLKKSIVFAVLYILIYQVFGYFVAWQFEEVRLFYTGDNALLGFIPQTLKNIKEMPFFLPYHFIRGLLWIFFSIPILLMVRETKLQTIISLMLLFSYHGFQIILANGIFPQTVAMAHAIETTISATIYGGLIGYLFYVPPKTEKRSGDF